ncbi:hypothetical protein PR048_023859 [Dryococelus australis]|uniref:Uncharacterized protein n=1 Tax=Dryococelus australis TaxID=614101 RepID=A0ABQ9GVA2_9NEOP|nr:hypothetical protein PR048_023859 [Dryococelus australis]
MATEDVGHVLKIIEPIAKKKDTHMRNAIPIKERLRVTLRFLETDVKFPAPIGRNGRQTRHDTSASSGTEHITLSLSYTQMLVDALAESLMEVSSKTHNLYRKLWTTYCTTTSNTKISVRHGSSICDIGRSF